MKVAKEEKHDLFIALLYRVSDPTPPAGLHQMNVGGVA
jgi:hypothetical protein